MQDQEDFIREQEQRLLQEQKDRVDNAASESDQEAREAAGRLEIKGVMLRAMSLELDRFDDVVFTNITFHSCQLAACHLIRSICNFVESLRILFAE